MSDPKAGKYHKNRGFAKDFEIALKTVPCAAGLFWSKHDYEAFRYCEQNVTLIFYPHRTTARNYHLRVRDGGSKDQARAIRLMDELDKAAGYNCTFRRKR